MNWQLQRLWWQFRQQMTLTLPGGMTALVVAGLFQVGIWQPLEYLAYNALFQSRKPIPWHKQVVLVAIDEESLRELGHFPWSRQQYTALLDVLAPAAPSVVVFNVLLSEQSPEDPQLAAAMERQGRVVLAQGWDHLGSLLLPSPTLRTEAIAEGHIFNREDADGVTRKIIPQLQGNLALGVSAAEVYSLVKESVALPSLQHPLWINWPGPSQQLQQYSFVKVLQGQVPAQAFTDKVVLVGITAAGFDPLITPFDRNPPASGVYLHAAVISNLLQHNALHKVEGQWLLLLILLLGGPSLSYVMAQWHTTQQLAGLTALCVGWWGLSLLLFQLGYWLPVALPMGLFVFTGGAVALSERLRENALLKQEVEQLWQTHCQDLVVEPASVKPILEMPRWKLKQQPASIQGVTKLAALAAQLGRSQSAQAAIARSLSIGLLAADLDGRVWFCNPVAADWLELQVGDRLPNHLIPEWLSDPQWQTALADLKNNMPVSPQELQRGESWFLLKLESLCYQPVVVGMGTAQYQIGEVPTGLLLVLENITDQKQVEANLSRQMEELQRMNLLKDDFLNTVSHELRTPMTNMKMAIHLLKIAPSEKQRHHYLQILQDECDREIGLINDLLDLQRLEAEAKPLVIESIALKEWLPQVIEPFQSRAHAHQQTLEIRMSPQLPSLNCDRSSLERILAELLNNACKYTPSDGLISVNADALDGYVEIMVSNSGVEIPAEELSRIFDKFYRIPRNDPWKQGGTGLGLALVQRLVGHLGGTIQVASQANITTFTLKFPLDIHAVDT